MNPSEVAKLIGIIRARYPRAEWGPNDALTVEAWHMSLADLPLDAVLAALRALFNASPFAPDPAEIRTQVFAAAGLAPEPSEAWAIARGAIRAYYPGQPFSHELPAPVYRALRAIGGVHNLKFSEEPSRDRDAFLRAYAIERKRTLAETGLSLPAMGEGAHGALTRGQEHGDGE